MSTKKQNSLILEAATGVSVLRRLEKSQLTYKLLSSEQKKSVSTFFNSWFVVFASSVGLLTIFTVSKLWAFIALRWVALALGLLTILGAAFFVLQNLKFHKKHVSYPIENVTREAIKAMTSTEFECFVAQLYEKLKYKVELTRHGADGGIDVRAWKNDELFIIQCKHWVNKASVELIRELHGLRESHRAKGSIFVCTGGFTDPAKLFAQENNIVLVDTEDLMTIVSLLPREFSQCK